MTYRGWLGGCLLAALAATGGACAAGAGDGSGDATDDGASGATTSDGVGGAGSSTTATGAGGDPDIGTGGGSTGTGGCSDEAKLVYVLGKTRELYAFDPGALSLTSVGVVECDSGGATPFSMSVDRNGTAWLVYNDGHLFQVDTKTAACQPTAFAPNQHGYKTFGMGFVADAPGSTAETLYVANEVGIAKIDTSSLSLTPIGDFGFSAAAELTGTGDARLFGFFFGFPPYISQIDKGTSALLDEAPLDSVDIGTGFAFAFWGGDFWVFTAPNGTSSQIDRYQPANGTTTTVKTNLGFKVVGAGVSTCAPVEAPK